MEPCLSRLLAFCHEAILGGSVKWFALSTNRFAFAGLLLAFPYKAHFGRSMKWLALSTNCLAFARLRHRGGDKARGDQSNKSTRLIATSGLFLKLSLGL